MNSSSLMFSLISFSNVCLNILLYLYLYLILFISYYIFIIVYFLLKYTSWYLIPPNDHLILSLSGIHDIKRVFFFSPFAQIYPGAVELMQVIEEFIHIVGLGMKDFHNAYLMTGNLGENRTLCSTQAHNAPRFWPPWSCWTWVILTKTELVVVKTRVAPMEREISGFLEGE